jgi:hypothetical protein
MVFAELSPDHLLLNVLMSCNRIIGHRRHSSWIP